MLLSNWLPWGKKHACLFFFHFSPASSNQCFTYAHGNDSNYVFLCFSWRLVSTLQCCSACFALDGLHGRRTGAHPWTESGPPAPLDGALFPQRPKLLCFKEDIFRTCCLAGGRTFFLNRRADCNRIPLFSECLLPFSLSFSLFFCHLVSVSLSPSRPCLLFLSSSVSLSVSLFLLHKNLIPQGRLQRVRKGPAFASRMLTFKYKPLPGPRVPQWNSICWLTAGQRSGRCGASQSQALAFSSKNLARVNYSWPLLLSCRMSFGLTINKFYM